MVKLALAAAFLAVFGFIGVVVINKIIGSNNKTNSNQQNKNNE